MATQSKARIIVYGTKYCPYCTAARMLLKKMGVDFEDVLFDNDTKFRAEIERKSGRRTVPQIFIDDNPIGGFDELYALEQDGKLDRILDSGAPLESN